MIEKDVVLLEKGYQLDRAKGFGIVSYYLLREAKPRHNIFFKELDEYEVNSLLSRDGLFAFSKIVNNI